MLTMSAHNVLVWVAEHTGPLIPLRASRTHHSLAAGEHWCTVHKRGCPVETFTHNRTRPDGLETYCREARTAWEAQRAARVKEML